MTGLQKEFRTLAWPAAVVLAAVVLPWLAWTEGVFGGPGWLVQAGLTAFVLGTALLVALPFGAEFQQRTMVMLLSQPVSRSRVWFQKWGALLVVLSVLAALPFVGLQAIALDDRGGVRATTFLVVLACSGFFWTLVAGSTIGGAVFSLAGLMLVEMASAFVTSRLTGLEIDAFASHPAPIAVRLAYATLALWCGWRFFSRFEVKAQGEGAPGLSPGALGAVPALRCRPNGAVANLVRKEVRLQQPTVLIAALFTLCWLVAMLVFAMPPDRPGAANIVFTTLLMGYFPLVLLVCGTISIGEDTSMGIRPWHLTLPVSSLVQWGIKLGVTVMAAAVLALALPALLVALTPVFVTLPASMIQVPSAGRIVAAAFAVLAISFWSATLVGHTIKAAVGTGIALIALAVCGSLGWWLGNRLGVGTDLLTWIMVQNQLSPDSFRPGGVTMTQITRAAAMAAIVILSVLALRQSLAGFRRVQVDSRRIALNAFQLAVVFVVLSFIPVAYTSAASEQYRSQPVREMEAALQQVSAAAFAATDQIPAVVDARVLEATGLLSEDTRRWLKGSRIALNRTRIQSRDGERFRYGLAHITFPNGRSYRMLYRMPPEPMIR